jgi:hypothetical protein
MIHFKNLKPIWNKNKNLKDVSDTNAKLQESTYALGLYLKIIRQKFTFLGTKIVIC